jgi:hypothetical protein
MGLRFKEGLRFERFKVQIGLRFERFNVKEGLRFKWV